MELKCLSHSEKETKSIAFKLAQLLKPGDIVTLNGNLGAGKTTFTKGLAFGLEVKRPVTSPTFNIVKEYHGRLPLYHIDAYRLENSEEDIGFEEYFYGQGVTVVEWAVFIKEFLPDNYLTIHITYEDETKRNIKFQAFGDYYKKLLKMLELGEEIP